MTGAGTRRRVAITGLGLISPAGNTVDHAFATILKGQSMARPVPELVDGGIAVQFACPVEDFDPGA